MYPLGQQLTEPQLCEDQSRPACCYVVVSVLARFDVSIDIYD